MTADQADYRAFLNEFGLAETFVSKCSKSSCYDFQSSIGLAVGHAGIIGHGMFATLGFYSGEKISTVIDRGTVYQCARYLNHSAAPNAEFRFDGEAINLFAVSDIRPGDDVTVNYRDSFTEALKYARAASS